MNCSRASAVLELERLCCETKTKKKTKSETRPSTPTLPSAEKMEEKEANAILSLLEIQEDDDGLIKYMGKCGHFLSVIYNVM